MTNNYGYDEDDYDSDYMEDVSFYFLFYFNQEAI